MAGNTVRASWWAMAMLCSALAQAQTSISPARIAELLKAREPRLQATLRDAISGLERNPRSVSDIRAAAETLDLLGAPDTARELYNRLLEVVRTPEDRISIQRAMGISRAFAGDCKGAEAVENNAVVTLTRAGEYYGAGEVANEIGRICLDVGDWANARKWYSAGHSYGLREENLSKERFALWDFRWLNAQARIAVRRGDTAEARKRMQAAVALSGKGLAVDQLIYIPYLKGYVTFYSGAYEEARIELEKAEAEDPFAQCLLGRAYEHLGFPEKALERYQFVAQSTLHNVNTATAMYWLSGRANQQREGPPPAKR